MLQPAGCSRNADGAGRLEGLPKIQGGKCEERRLMVTGKQWGAESLRAVARARAGNAGQSAWRGEHSSELCKQQEARKKPPASSGAMLGRNTVALGDSAHNSWASAS